MTVLEQVWGTANEKIHTVGTACLAFSALAYIVLRVDVKAQALVVFVPFAGGVTLVGLSVVRNSWTRWRTGEDSLVLLRRRSPADPIHSVAVHVLGWRVEWSGRVAHIDVGEFTARRLCSDDAVPVGSSWSRGYAMFRAVYWMACSSLLFQSSFGLGALLYGLWLLQFLHRYSQSTV